MCCGNALTNRTSTSLQAKAMTGVHKIVKITYYGIRLLRHGKESNITGNAIDGWLNTWKDTVMCR